MQGARTGQIVLDAMMVLIPMILSLSVHEFAHAAAAFRLGDSTAAQQGKLTLNPAAHADIFGSVLLPLMGVIASHGLGLGRMPFIGYAKPTPVNTRNFRPNISVRRGAFLVAAVGPVSNLLLAILAAAGLALVLGGNATWVGPARSFCEHMFFVNLSLFIFNMLPIGPLDGQKMVSNLLATPRAIAFDAFNTRYAFALMMFFFVFASSWLRFPVSFLARGILWMVGLGGL